jgi:NAD(P)H-hydrate repair Nnr-like enzyme with NAD(P)H-hydrate epimerase domain
MELITNAQMALVDTLATEAATDPTEALFELMVNAGRAVAQHVMR